MRICVKEFTSSKFGKSYLIRSECPRSINLRKILEIGDVEILDEISYIAKTSKRAITYGLDIYIYLKNKFKFSEAPTISYILEIHQTSMRD